MFGFKKRRRERELAWLRFNEVVQSDLCKKLQSVAALAVDLCNDKQSIAATLDEAEELQAGIHDFFVKSAARQPEDKHENQTIGYRRGFSIAKSTRNLAMLNEHLDNPNTYGDFLHAFGLSRDLSVFVSPIPAE